MTFNAHDFLLTVPHKPGVYRMFDATNTIIYIGKARDLRKRLSQYFLKDLPNVKTKALVSKIEHIEFTVTFSETDALLLECNLIKEFQPQYNILLRDDKSYPYIILATNERHARIGMHRGPKRIKGEYFGPYPSSGAVKESLKKKKKIFPIRQCADSVYRSRSRPCLLFQLGRCSGPCTPGNISDSDYANMVSCVKMFLEGKDQEIIKKLVMEMEGYSDNLEFEKAALVRDRILALRKVQEDQTIFTSRDIDFDVIATSKDKGIVCVHVLFIRAGRLTGTRSYFPKVYLEESDDDILRAFILEFYINHNDRRNPPQEIICHYQGDDLDALGEAIDKVIGRKVKIGDKVSPEKLKYLKLASANALASLKARLEHASTINERTNAFAQLIGVDELIRLECFDISHTMGENTVASCVVFDKNGPVPSEYRRFNITNITPGDDYAAMHQALSRRFSTLENAKLPQVLFIDGGKGQLHQAEEIISEKFAQNEDLIPPILIGVAKGEGRKVGLETLIFGYTHQEVNLSIENPALQLVVHIRDESHRFAITGHRNKRAKARTKSTLQDIPGIGDKRRQAILKHLGGMQEVMGASAQELAKVPGISKELAQTIYDYLHS